MARHQEPNQTRVGNHHPRRCVYVEENPQGLCRSIIKPQSYRESKKTGRFLKLRRFHFLEARNNSIQILILPYLIDAKEPEFMCSFQHTASQREPGTLGAWKVKTTASTWRTFTRWLNLTHEAPRSLTVVLRRKSAGIPFYRGGSQGFGGNLSKVTGQVANRVFWPIEQDTAPSTGTCPLARV